MTNHEQRYRIAAGDRIRSKYGTTKGLEGVVVKVFRSPPSIDAGFDPNIPALRDFAVGSNGLVNYRLDVGEFEVIDKTKYSIPKGNT